MKKTSGRDLLRARLNTPALYCIFNVIFAVLIVFILILTIFFNTNTFYFFQWYGLLGAAVGGVLLSMWVYWLFTLFREPSGKAEIFLVILFMALLVALQSFVGWQVRVLPGDSWDYGQVFQYASDRVLLGTQPDDYFLLYPHNTAFYTLLCGYFALLNLAGVGDFLLPTMILNIAAIASAVILLYFTCRRLFGVRQGLFLLGISCLMSPFLLYAPILYTDTLTLPVPVGMVLLWLIARSRWREGKFRSAILCFGSLSVLAAVGALFRVTVLIVWFAIVIDLLLFICGKGRSLLLLVGTVLLAAVLVGGTFALRSTPLLPRYDYALKGMPITQGFMMGLSYEGRYNETDSQWLVLEEDRGTRSLLISEEIGNRLADLGIVGFFQHLGTKLSYTFGDGSYTAAAVLDENPANPLGVASSMVSASGSYFGLYAHFAFAMEAAILFWMAFSSMRGFFRRNEALAFVRVSIFGLVVFLLFWETQARYLIQFLPLFMLCAVEVGPRPRERARQDSLEKVSPDEQKNEPQETPLMAELAYPDYMDPTFQWEQQFSTLQTQESRPQGSLVDSVEPQQEPELFSKMNDS